MTQSVYLSLGANLGNRERTLTQGLEELARLGEVMAVSSWYDTVPVGGVEQGHFINLAVMIVTGLPPAELLRAVKKIETKLGRVPGRRWGPRALDIDILLYGDWIVREPHLCIPHPEIPRRAFVLVPLAEIAPDAVHPESGLTVAELLAGLSHTDSVRRIEPDQTPNRSSVNGSPSL